MDKVWIYLGGIIVAGAVLAYTAISVVNSTHPPANDLRATYEKVK